MKTFFFKPFISVVFLLLVFSFWGCNKDNDSERVVSMTIASDMKMGKLYWNNVEINCFQVKEDDSSDWTLFDPRLLVGFNYEEGYEYVIKVKKSRVGNPAQDDGPEFSYQFINIVSKEKKTVSNYSFFQ